MKVIVLTHGQEAFVDDEDYESLSKYHWNINNKGYAYRKKNYDHKQHAILMHREIMGAKPGEKVDHRNHVPLDNRRENLRICTQSQNMRNRRPKRKYIGVREHHGSWVAYIYIDGKQRYLGAFLTAEQAAFAHDQGAKDTRFADFITMNNVPEQELPRRRPHTKLVKKQGATSRYIGVSWGTREGRWQAEIRRHIDGKNVHLFLGYFDKEEDAAAACRAKADELDFGKRP